jgi:hypothetical protein
MFPVASHRKKKIVSLRVFWHCHQQPSHLNSPALTKGSQSEAEYRNLQNARLLASGSRASDRATDPVLPTFPPFPLSTLAHNHLRHGDTQHTRSRDFVGISGLPISL